MATETQADAAPPRPAAHRAIWHAVKRYEAGKMNPWLALRNTVGVALPLVAFALTGHVLTGVALAIGALNVSYSDGLLPYRQRGLRMLTSSLFGALAVTAGAAVGANHLLATLLAAAWAFAGGLLIALGATAGDIGVISLVMLVVFSARPMAPAEALSAGLLALAGGLFQTALSIAFWPLRRYVPERRALADLYEGLAEAAVAPASAQQGPPATQLTSQAQQALVSLGWNFSRDSERYRVLLSQAERIRLGVLALDRLRQRMGKADAVSAAAAIGLILGAAARVLHAVGASLRTSHPTSAPTLAELEGLREQLQQASYTDPLVAALADDALYQIDALTGQLRASVELAVSSTPAGEVAVEARERRYPWYLRLSSSVAILRANLTLRSTAFRHAIRLAFCVALGETIGRSLSLERSYWLPMTIVIVLKPDFTTTFSRGAMRFAGTLSGLAVATVLFHFLPAGMGWQLALIAVLTFLLRWAGPANYGVFTLAISAIVVFLIALTGIAPKDVVVARAVNTVLGGLLALTVYGLWPTWERTQVAPALARLLDAYRDYFRLVAGGYLAEAASSPTRLDAARLEARLARADIEVSVDRLGHEPGTPPAEVDTVVAMLASSHRLIHAVMALEAGLTASRSAPAREAFRKFAHDVDLTLYFLVAWLRRHGTTSTHLPDLRAAHRELIAAGEGVAERYALVNTETDRITNSLNTLSGQMIAWLEERSPASA